MGIVDSGGGTPRRLLDPAPDAVYELAFSPDGEQIAYFTGGGDHSHTLRVMNSDGTDSRTLLFRPEASHIEDLDWSPDGQRLMFSFQPGEGGIWIVGLDGSDPTQVVPDGVNPAWSPDGTRISYEEGDYTSVSPLQIADAGGTQPDTTSCRGSTCATSPMRVATVELPGDRTFTQNIGDATVRTKFYTAIAHDGQPTGMFEEAFSLVEAEAANAWREVTAGAWLLTDEARIHVAGWIALQFLRGSRLRTSMKQLGTDMLQLQAMLGGRERLREALRTAGGPHDEESATREWISLFQNPHEAEVLLSVDSTEPRQGVAGRFGGFRRPSGSRHPPGSEAPGDEAQQPATVLQQQQPHRRAGWHHCCPARRPDQAHQGHHHASQDENRIPKAETDAGRLHADPVLQQVGEPDDDSRSGCGPGRPTSGRRLRQDEQRRGQQPGREAECHHCHPVVEALRISELGIAERLQGTERPHEPHRNEKHGRLLSDEENHFTARLKDIDDALTTRTVLPAKSWRAITIRCTWLVPFVDLGDPGVAAHPHLWSSEAVTEQLYPAVPQATVPVGAR